MKHTCMRRATAVLLLLVFLLPLAACQRPAEPSPASTPTATGAPTPEPIPVPLPEPTPESTPEVTLTPEPAPEPAPEPFVFTKENFPRLNGSTSTVPLAEAVCSTLLGEDPEEVGDLIQFSRTTNSYFALMDGSADLILAAECNEQVEEWKEKSHFEWLKTPFATDAFVFVVNEENPVDSITVDQARKIYTGEITNWAELGGEDEPILPFQRNPEAGSQTLMEKLVMRGTPMMEPPSDFIVGSMGGLMEAVKSYDNSAGAIGYSVYYYAEEMRAARGLKLLKLEGVEPTAATIRSGDYPLVNPYYVVISAETGENAPARKLYDWVLSPEGQALASELGYVPVLDLETAPRAIEPPEPVGKPYVGEWKGLGPLASPEIAVPYAGARLDHSWESLDGCLYGLMTRDGTALTPPVYNDIRQLSWIGWLSGEQELLPLLVLRQGVLPTEDSWGWEDHCTLAALDLSWVFPETWRQVLPGRDYALLLGETTLVQVSLAGEILQSWDLEEAGLSDYRSRLESPYRWITGFTAGNVLCLKPEDGSEGDDFPVLGFRLDTGAVESFSQEELEEMERAGQPERPEARWTVTETENGSLFTRDGERLELPVPALGKEALLLGDLVVYEVLGRIFLRDGTELLPPEEGEEYRYAYAYDLLGGTDPEGVGDGVVWLCRSREGEERFSFLRLDGSLLLEVRPTAADGERVFSYEVCQGVLGIVELDKASYYDVETGDCVFRIWFGYGLD